MCGALGRKTPERPPEQYPCDVEQLIALKQARALCCCREFGCLMVKQEPVKDMIFTLSLVFLEASRI